MKFRTGNNTLTQAWRQRMPAEAATKLPMGRYFGIRDQVPEDLAASVLCAAVARWGAMHHGKH
ncbi:TPA: hypothetical protein ACH3X2_007810 [Trebouxia sp. C0005]